MIIVDICGDNGKIVELKFKHVRIHSFFYKNQLKSVEPQMFLGFWDFNIF